MRHKRGCRRGTHAGRGALVRSADPLQPCGRGGVDCQAQAAGLFQQLGPTTQPPAASKLWGPHKHVCKLEKKIHWLQNPNSKQHGN